MNWGICAFRFSGAAAQSSSSSSPARIQSQSVAPHPKESTRALLPIGVIHRPMLPNARRNGQNLGTSRGRPEAGPRAIPYDTLVVAIGSVTNDFGTPGAAEFAVPLETAEQAVRFHHRLVNAGLRAQAQGKPIQAGQLHVAIIGAGATGTELAAE